MSPTIQHLSQAEAQMLPPPSVKSIMVSIVDAGCAPADLEPGWCAVLRLEFDDIDGSYGEFKVFSWKQAFRVVDFMHEHAEADNISVHCRYGIARSAAVALYSAWLQGTMLTPKSEGFNQLVLNRLLLAHAVHCLQCGQLSQMWRALRQRISGDVPIASLATGTSSNR